MSSYDPDHHGIAEFLNSSGMLNLVEQVAGQIRDRAIATAPIGDPRDDEHSGRYKASFHIRSHHHGGATNDRAEAIVYNDAPEALEVEFGHRGREPYHTLLRAAEGVRWMLCRQLLFLLHCLTLKLRLCSLLCHWSRISVLLQLCQPGT